jgi:small conductance mechanosensitive channel
MSDFLNGIWDRLAELFDPNTLGTLLADWIANAVVGLIVMAAFVLLWLLLKWLARPFLKRADLDETATVFTMTILKFTVLGIGFVNAMNAAGINTAAVLTSVGIAGLTIGFAARDAFSNLISGFLIYLDRPFVIGDLVEIEDNYGRVDQITLRSTRIITSDGKMLAVPNADIINKIVASYTNFPHLRLDIPVTVGVDENLAQVRRILLDTVAADERFMDSPAPRVVVQALNDYNVAMELQAWIYDERAHVENRSELREKVFDALNQAGVEMPFETLQLRPLRVELDR